jgi:hypothetical protein
MAVSERQWVCQQTNKTYSVDSNLEDAWLEALNGFEHLYLRSICEGHPDGARLTSAKSMPILRLSVSSNLASTLRREHRSPKQKIAALFADSPLASAADIEQGWSDFNPDDYFIHLDAKKDRASDHMETWVREWFSDAISFLTHVDAYLVSCHAGDFKEWVR